MHRDPDEVLEDIRRVLMKLSSCTIVVGRPNELVAEIHDRMVVILPEQAHAQEDVLPGRAIRPRGLRRQAAIVRRGQVVRLFAGGLGLPLGLGTPYARNEAPPRAERPRKGD